MAMSRFLRPLKLQERQAYLFNDYWEDIGTIISFFEANLAFTEHPPRFSFYDAAKPMYTSRRNLPPTKIDNSKIVDSIISHGCFMTNSSIEHSVIGIRSRISSNIHLKDSVMLGADYYETDTEVATLLAEGRVPIGIGENTKINDCIIDKNARIGKNVVIANSVGIQEADRSSQGFYIRSGITIVLKNLVTCCKHEYHLHCILEWSQRSKECPICWQSLALKDPASQELLAAVEAEKCLRSRNVYSSSITNSRMPFERLNDDHDDSCSDDSDFDEQIMQHLVAAASRARFVQRQKRQGSSGAGPSEILVFNSSMHVSGVQPTRTTSPSGGSSPTPGVPLSVDIQHPTSAFSVIVDEEVARNTSPETDVPYRHRVLYSQQPPESARRLNTSEMFSFPESIKSKFSAASARYKESISKSTRGLKEKLLARNATVKELSKGVQREMNAGIAGVARMIERLDLTSRRSNSPLIPVCTEGTSGFPKEGKSAEENGIGHSPNEESGDVNVIHDVSSDAPSLVSSMVAGRMEIPSCVQSGHDAVKT